MVGEEKQHKNELNSLTSVSSQNTRRVPLRGDGVFELATGCIFLLATEIAYKCLWNWKE